jgi:methylated-DNA-[protein]-cysteine S-methyltransferase
MMERPTFTKRVHLLVQKVPKGKITTYRDLAYALGTGACRAVGQAMRRSPGMPEVPCHRVVSSDGSIGGFFGETQGEPVQRKIAMLKREGVLVKDGKVVDFERKKHTF